MVIKKFLNKFIQIVGANWHLQRMRVRLNFYFRLKSKLLRQLTLTEDTLVSRHYAGKKVLVPVIETSHYMHQHMLGLAKALQIRGADVTVLRCGEILDGCEIKSIRNEADPDPCWTCRQSWRLRSPPLGSASCSTIKALLLGASLKTHSKTWCCNRR